MPNQLTLPFKTTSVIPLRSALRDYIQSVHTETHPDAFKWDISKWESMRKDATSHIIHVGTVDKVIAYQAQLVFILTKLPADINLEIPYSRAFPPNSDSLPLALSNLVYERANVLYNLAALYCKLAASEDRSHGDGIKRALAHFQNAAGALSHLISSALPALEASLPHNTALPTDLSQPFIHALELLMLSQAQECFWQKAVVDNLKNALVAKLAFKASSLYRQTLDAMETDPTISALFTREWIFHVRTKYHHFAAAALYRKSVDDLEANRYGEELARLDMARAEAKKALESARRTGVARAVQDDIKSLYDTLESSSKRAERDNDLIYHHVVPSTSSIPPIQDMKDVVMSIVSIGLRDPKSAVKEGETILGELTGWGVRVAVDIYKERKKDWVQVEIIDRAKQLDTVSTTMLHSLNLPAALDALDRPIGLPPSLLGKAEEVRREEGMTRIPALIEDVRRLAKRNAAALDEALDILDQEATEDEEMREAYSVDVWTRPPSHEANQELTDKATRYREIIDKAAETDREVCDKWEESAEQIGVLCWDESDIERAIPNSTMSGGGSKSTQGHARALRAHLESLDDLVRARTELVQRVQRMADSDDVGPRFMREAAAFARWIEVRPEIFEQSIEEELAKYDRYREELEEDARRQEEALDGIKERNTLFLESRREDPSVKTRERALQSLDLAYHQYRDIHKSLTEGIKFYNDLATILGNLMETCRVWVLHRRKDVDWLTESLNSMNVATQDAGSPPAHIVPQQYDYEYSGSASHDDNTLEQSMPSQPVAQRPLPPQETDELAASLPPPNSSAWETITMPPQKTVRRSKQRV